MHRVSHRYALENEMTEESPVASAFPALTYAGALDDKVQQFPWRYRPDIETLNAQLIGQALFGNPLLLNDGYFVANPAIHRSLVDGPESIIGALAQEGFIKIYIRDQNFDLMKGIADAAQSGVADHRDTLSEDAWTERVRPYLEDLIPRMQWASESWPTPMTANVGKIFYELMESRIDKGDALQLSIGPAAVYEAFRIFDDRIDKANFGAARTIWEQQAIPAYLKANADADPSRTSSELMMLGNEAYHFAHAIAAERKFGSRQVGVQTALSMAFADLIEQEPLPEDDQDRRQRTSRYLYSMPKKIRVSGSGLRHLMYPRAGIGRMKKEYIDGLNRYLAGMLADDEMQRLYAAYRDELADHLSRYERVSRAQVRHNRIYVHRSA